jgi:hypothetical protein
VPKRARYYSFSFSIPGSWKVRPQRKLGWKKKHMFSVSTFYFFLGRNLAETDGCKISAHVALRLLDSDCLDEAVGLLRVDSTVVKIVRNGGKESAEEYPQFMVRPG